MKAHELEEAENRFVVTILQQGGHIGPRPTPEKRKGKFRRKALRKEQIISEPSGKKNEMYDRRIPKIAFGLRFRTVICNIEF
jgi:hypothetical protein